MLRALLNFWTRLRCHHSWRWSHNYYGDQIIYNGWNRSAWKCPHCGAWKDRPELHPDPKRPETCKPSN